MKAPYKVIYSNDTTNILTCTSPYHAQGEPFRPQMLEATVDEVAGTGVDAHFIQLAHGQVPWYKSKVYPMEEHLRWWREHFGADPMKDSKNVTSVHQYLLDGGDLLQVFIDRCRQTGQSPFVSLRLNDVHFVNHVHDEGNVLGTHAISRFYVENLDCRLGADLNDWLQRTLDWSRKAVRDHMFAMIREQCEAYDIDGFELDFMRFPNFFNQEQTTREQRVAIMTEFIACVRELLDRTARNGQHRWLCVRIPAHQTTHDRLGIDLPRWADAGVEMFNLSYHYFTEQDGDYATLRQLVPESSMYVEMTHTTSIGPPATSGEHDNFTFRRTTPHQFETTAHLARANGLDGVSLFNFVYYRPHGGEARGPFHEPPFAVFANLAQADLPARHPQHYFLAKVWDCPRVPDRPLPRAVHAGQTEAFTLLMASPADGWRADGRLRLQGASDLGAGRWRAVMNGTELVETQDRSEPYDNPYPTLLEDAKRHRAWIVPAGLCRKGRNTIELTLLAGDPPATVVFLDLAMPDWQQEQSAVTE